MIIKYNIDTSLIKFDSIFYKKYYNDLSHLNNEELIHHYILHGKNEKRIFCDIQYKFDWLQYYTDYKLENNNLNDIYEIWKHYLYNEYKNLHIKDKEKIEKSIIKINNIIEFNHIYYSKKHIDLSNFSKYKLYEHFHNYGRCENRIFCDIINQFNWLYYYLIYNDLKFKSIEDIWKHYIYNGVKEQKYIAYSTIIDFLINNLKEDQSFVYLKELPQILKSTNYQLINSRNNDNNVNSQLTNPKNNSNNGNNRNNSNNVNYQLISQRNNGDNLENGNGNNRNNGNSQLNYKNINVPKTAIIYVYYNRPGELCNESNLAFFIRQTVLKDKTNIYLFIINGYTCEIIFPQQNNLYVLKNKNCYDFEAYGYGITYLRQKLDSNFNGIQRIVTMNCSVTGPFYRTSHWLSEFENRLNRDNAFCCSTVLYRLEKLNNNIDSDIRTPGYFNYFINDSNIINQLLQKVFIRHNTKINCINSGEYGFAKLLISNNN